MPMFWHMLANRNALYFSNIKSQTDASEINKVAFLFAILLEF